jgi:hypothetical protein
LRRSAEWSTERLHIDFAERLHGLLLALRGTFSSNSRPFTRRRPYPARRSGGSADHRPVRGSTPHSDKQPQRPFGKQLNKIMDIP